MTTRLGGLALTLFFVSVASHADEAFIEKSFPAEGIDRVILRAAKVETAAVVHSDDDRSLITFSGKATGGTVGYHPADPNWKETPASQWVMKFVSKRVGSTLIVSTQNEIGYLHHWYTVENITVRLPKTVQLLRFKRALSGSGAPECIDPTDPAQVTPLKRMPQRVSSSPKGDANLADSRREFNPALDSRQGEQERPPGRSPVIESVQQRGCD